MWVRLLKELRQLGMAGVAAAVVPVLAALAWPDGVAASVFFGLLSFVLAARLFGAELDHHTLPRLLDQPLPRWRIWAEKMLAGAIALTFALAALLLTLGLHGRDEAMITWWLLLPAFALATTPTLSLMLRDSVRSVWAGLALWVSLYMLSALVWGLTERPLVTVILAPYCLAVATWCYVLRDGMRSVWVGLALCTGLYAAAGGIWALTGVSWVGVLFAPYGIVVATSGCQRFRKLELAADNRRPSPRWPAAAKARRRPLRLRASGATFRLRASGATGATIELVLKELRLQRSGLALVPVALALWLATWLPSLGGERVRESDLPVLASYLLVAVLFVVVPALISANAVAAERQLGVLAWQLATPVSRRFQWRVKLACCLVLTLLASGLGVVLARLVEARLPIQPGPGSIPLLVALSLVALAFGLLGSQLARHPFGALGRAAILAAAGAYLCGILSLTSNFAGMAWPELVEPWLRLSSPFGHRPVDLLCALTLLALVFATPPHERWLTGGRMVRSPVLRAFVALALLALATQIYILGRASRELDRELAAKGAELVRLVGGEGTAEALTRDAAALVPLLDYGHLVSLEDPALRRSRYRQPVSAAMSLVAGVDGIEYTSRTIDRWFWLREARGAIYSGSVSRHQMDGYFTLRGRWRSWHPFTLVPLWFQDHRCRQLDRRMRQNVALEAVRMMPSLERSPAVDRDRLRRLMEQSPLASTGEANRPPAATIERSASPGRNGEGDRRGAAAVYLHDGHAMTPDRSQRATPSRWADLWLALGVSVAGLYFFGGWWTSVRFVAEEIEVRVDRQTIDVEGIYLYRNRAPWPALLTLAIPCPIDGDHPAPFGLALDEVDEFHRAIRRLTPATRGDDVSLRLLFAPRQERRLRLRYSQLARSGWGRYLLTTTRAWRKPVGRAKLTLSLAPGQALLASSYRLTPLDNRAGWERFGFERTRFWPDRDWDFAWEPKEVKR